MNHKERHTFIITMGYLEAYLSHEESPSPQGFAEYILAEEELDNEMIAKEKLATEESLRRDFV